MARSGQTDQIGIVSRRRQRNVRHIARAVVGNARDSGLPRRFGEEPAHAAATGPDGWTCIQLAGLVPNYFGNVGDRRTPVDTVLGIPVRRGRVIDEPGTANRQRVRRRGKRINRKWSRRVGFRIGIVAAC